MKHWGWKAIGVLISAVSTCTVTSEQPPVQIIRTGVWAGEDVHVESGDGWWGIFPRGDGFFLESARLTITRAYDGINDAKGEMTGKAITVEQAEEPVVLVRGGSALVAGPLSTVRHDGRWEFLYPGQSVSLHLDPSNQEEVPMQITALGTAIASEGSPQVLWRDYGIRLSQGPSPTYAAQIIANFPEFWNHHVPHLVWAGDLDRDGKLDLLYNLSTWHMAWHLGLFLSTAAREGELVGLVAEWHSSGD